MTRNFLNILGVVALGAGLLAATPAEARFGKSSSSEEKPSHQKKYRTKKSRASGEHAASAVGSEPRSGRHSGYVVRPHVRVYRPWYYFGFAPQRTVIVHEHVQEEYPQPQPAPEPEESPIALRRFELGGTVQPLLNGGVFGLNLLVDWSHMGIDLRFDDLALRAGDGYDHIRLLNASATFALIDGSRGRLRAHLGAYGAFAPDIAMLGPGGGLSASADVLGPFTAEASGQLVLFPFTQVDTRAAVGLRLGPIEGRLGWRFLLLDDQGRVDGVRNIDLMTGPYVGALFRI